MGMKTIHSSPVSLWRRIRKPQVRDFLGGISNLSLAATFLLPRADMVISLHWWKLLHFPQQNVLGTMEKKNNTAIFVFKYG